MKHWQATQFQIEPNGEQRRAMRQFAGNARKVWNLAWDRQQKNQAPTLQQVITDLGRGYQNRFEKRAAPGV